MIKVFIPLNPVPASRPKVGRWGTYYSKTYRNWKEKAEEITPRGPGELSGPLHVTTEVVVKKPPTSKLDYPHPDLDNFLKAGLDVLTKVGGYWHDDKQIISSCVVKRFAEPGEEEGTHITIQPCPTSRLSKLWTSLLSTARRLLKAEK